MSESNDEYEVERILGKRTRNGRTKYKIRWKGFDESDDSWEPEANLTHCTALIKQFNLDRERDQELIDRSLTEHPPLANGSIMQSPMWSSPVWSSTPGLRSGPILREDLPERVRLRWDSMVKTPQPKNDSSRKEKSQMDRSTLIDEPVSRWPLLLFLLLLLGLALYTLYFTSANVAATVN